MRMTTSTQPARDELTMRAAIVRRLIQVAVQTFLIVAILFVTSGRLDWVWAWAYIVTVLSLLAVNARIMSPEVIAERGRPQAEAKAWDKVITIPLMLFSLALFAVAGLDARFSWTGPLNLAIHFVALLFVVMGQLWFTWAMASNKYFATVVRIQAERGHTVCIGGPYRYMRHPGYIGSIVSFLGLPLFLGSSWALIPAGLVTLTVIVRTALEDRTLQAELPGYKEYAQRVRCRLLPGVW